MSLAIGSSRGPVPNRSRPRSGCLDAIRMEHPSLCRLHTTRRPRKPVAPKTVTMRGSMASLTQLGCAVVVVSGGRPQPPEAALSFTARQADHEPSGALRPCKRCGCAGRRACNVRNATGLTLCQPRARTIAQQPADPTASGEGQTVTTLGAPYQSPSANRQAPSLKRMAPAKVARRGRSRHRSLRSGFLPLVFGAPLVPCQPRSL